MERIKINTLVLGEEDTAEEDVTLFAIHCSFEIYRLVYMINNQLGINLSRTALDVDVVYRGNLSFYPLYQYFDKKTQIEFYIIANKSSVKPTKITSQGSLFMEENSYYTYLIPEKKTVDFFLKIKGSDKAADTLVELKKTPYVTTAYAVSISELKSHKNLIFN